MADNDPEAIARQLEALARDMPRLGAILVGLEEVAARHNETWKATMAKVNAILDGIDEEHPDEEALKTVQKLLCDLWAATADYNLKLRDLGS